MFGLRGLASVTKETQDGSSPSSHDASRPSPPFLDDACDRLS